MPYHVPDKQNIANTYVVASRLLISRSSDRRGKSFSSSHVMVWLGRDLNVGLWSAWSEMFLIYHQKSITVHSCIRAWIEVFFVILKACMLSSCCHSNWHQSDSLKTQPSLQGRLAAIQIPCEVVNYSCQRWCLLHLLCNVSIIPTTTCKTSIVNCHCTWVLLNHSGDMLASTSPQAVVFEMYRNTCVFFYEMGILEEDDLSARVW